MTLIWNISVIQGEDDSSESEDDKDKGNEKMDRRHKEDRRKQVSLIYFYLS